MEFNIISKGNPLSNVAHVLAINLSSVSCRVFYCMICAEGLHLVLFIVSVISTVYIAYIKFNVIFKGCSDLTMVHTCWNAIKYETPPISINFLM